MPFAVTYQEPGFIHAVYEGDLTMQGIQAIKEHDCRLVLSDYRRAVMAISILELYELPKLILERGREMNLTLYNIRRALIVPARAYETFRFFETVSLNKSRIVKIFTDEVKAREWLLEE